MVPGSSIRVALRLGLAAAVLGLAGCVGIAHTLVHVPPLEVHIDAPGGSVDVVLAGISGEPEALIALATDDGQVRHPSYERQTFNVGHRTGPLLFAKETRYIGSAVFIFPLPISEEASKRRAVFFRVDSRDVVYRVIVKGRTATARATALAETLAKLPPVLRGERPVLPPGPRWEAWFDAERRFYQSVKWEKARGLSVESITRTPDRDVLVVRIGPVHPE